MPARMPAPALAPGLALALMAAWASPVAAAIPGAALTSEAAAKSCEALRSLPLADTTIESAALVPAKAAERTAAGDSPGYGSFCRVVARVKSAPDSDIGVEIWLPIEGWTGVFHANGNGGFGGILASGYYGMAEGLRRGFATVTTDTGTAPATPLEGDALIGQPRKWRDWGRLSTHVMTVTGKAVTRAFYGRKPRKSYYTGCSTGGQQGLIEALYYPQDYDGILVGAPVINRTWGHAAVLWQNAAAHRTPGSLLSAAKLKTLNKAAVSACWRQGHGLAGDPFITDPLRCTFDPKILQCTAAASDNCLTPAEVDTARAFYSGPVSRDGTPLFFGLPPGSETPDTFGWSFLQTPIKGQPPFAGLFKWIFGTDWDWRQFQVERDMAKVDGQLDAIVNDATRGSLDPFIARGGKLIIYHGLADTLVPPGQSVAFHDQHAARSTSGAFGANVRLFLAPGMMHCGGGTGPDAFNSTLGIPPRPPVDDPQHDLFAALIAWAERGDAPDRIIATRFSAENPGEVALQRPLCPYPQRPVYRGWGSTRAAENFTCEAPASSTSSAAGSGG